MTEVFRPLFFAARIADDEVRIWKWQSLDDAIRTICRLVPEMKQTITETQVRLLANADRRVPDQLPLDEYAALWLARTMYAPGIPVLNEPTCRGMFDAESATLYAFQLLQNQRPADIVDFRSEFSRAMKDLLLIR